MTPTVLLATPLILALDKPAGMPVQPDPTGDPSLLEWAAAQERYATVGLPHRIDRPVSGVVLFALTAPALAVLNELFREGRVEKNYLAVVEGRLEGTGLRADRLAHDGRTRKARVQEAGGDAREVRLRYRSLACGDRYSLIEVVPEGGAFHQIRAQLGAMGHAIKGDVKYGARRGEPDRSIGLHASSIAIDHPFFGGAVRVEAPYPERGIWPKLRG